MSDGNGRIVHTREVLPSQAPFIDMIVGSAMRSLQASDPLWYERDMTIRVTSNDMGNGRSVELEVTPRWGTRHQVATSS